MQNSIWRWAVLAILAAGGSLVYGDLVAHETTKDAREVIKIGVVIPMSGEVGAYFQELATVMDKRTQELNTNPNNRYEYKIIFEDSRFEPKRSHLAAMKLISMDKVNVIVSLGAVSAKVIMPLAKNYQVPQLSQAYASACDGVWNFGYFMDFDSEVKLSLSTMKALGQKSYGMIMMRQEANVEFEKLLEKYRKNYGIENKGVFYYNAEDLKDYRPHLMRVREASPDMIYIAGAPTEMNIIFRQANQLGGFDKKWTSLETMDDVVAATDKKDTNGIWIAGMTRLTPERVSCFKHLGIVPQVQYSMYAYDLPKIIVEACETAGAKGKPTGQQIAQTLKETKQIETIFGSINQTEKGFFAAQPVLIYYENGEGREISLEELMKLKGIK